jgi:hypothetical protein
MRPQIPEIAKGKTPLIPLDRLSSDGITLNLYEIIQNIPQSRKHRFASADAQSSKEHESKVP